MCLTNSAKMVSYPRDQDYSNGSILEQPIIYSRSVDKEGAKVSRNLSVPQVQEFGGSNPKGPSAFVSSCECTEPSGIGEWKEAMKIIREAVKNGSNPRRRTSSRASSTDVGWQSTDHAAPVSASKPASATPYGPASTELNCRGDRNIAVKDVNGRRGIYSTDNVRIVSQPSVSTSRKLEEIKETSFEVNVNGLNLDQSRPGLCSTDNSQKVAQPSVSTDGLVKTSTSNEASCQPDLHERLNSIYDSVLVVDNVTIAKEVVQMLTNKYRHLVHACDTEVLF
jgi:hypothetical protein